MVVASAVVVGVRFAVCYCGRQKFSIFTMEDIIVGEVFASSFYLVLIVIPSGSVKLLGDGLIF